MLKFILFLFVIHLSFVISKSSFRIDNKRSKLDLPVYQDVDKYLKSIEATTNYLSNDLKVIEINFALGIFFVNVHLGRVLKDKGQNIPIQLLSRIKAIFDTNEEMLLYFHKTAKSGSDFMDRDLGIISDLFINSTYWIQRLKKLKYEAQPIYLRQDLENVYSKWNNYTDNVANLLLWSPSPKNSDICLVTLAINVKSKGNSSVWCPVANICYDMLTKGTDFGYALCHRLAFLLMADMGRGCSILSVPEDEELKQKMCRMAYAEAEFIAMNDYGVVDLMVEIMCLCATDGRAQFLRRTWLHKILDFQKSSGCYGVQYNTIDISRRLVDCNSHTTAVASGLYAAAVRYILEEYY